MANYVTWTTVQDKKENGGWECSSAAKRLPTIYQALGSILNTAKEEGETFT